MVLREIAADSNRVEETTHEKLEHGSKMKKR